MNLQYLCLVKLSFGEINVYFLLSFINILLYLGFAAPPPHLGGSSSSSKSSVQQRERITLRN
jgi:hypothetical protein